MNKKGMETIQDLIDEAKTRTVWWALCIFVITYFLSHTSKSMWMNLPISILLLCAIKILLHEVEFRWRVQPARRETYLSHLEKKQLSVDDPRLSSVPPSSKWKRKVDSPLVESAIDDFINKLLQDFVVDLWYSSISPDREVPEQMRSLINDILGEISGRVKQINLVDLLTRDMVDLIGNHLELYRRNQSAIGVEVMGTLSFEERDDRLKHHLITSKELHPALISPECEYKFLQRLMGGLLAVVLRPREAQCPLVRSIARELLTCLVMQPIMNLASPGHINELIEYLFLAKDDEGTGVGDDHSAGVSSHCNDHFVPSGTSLSREPNSKNSVAISNQRSGVSQSKISNERETSSSTSTHDVHGDPMQPRPADWVRVFEAVTQRRSEILAPENLENMWTKGRNYKNKHGKHKGGALPPSTNNSSGGNNDYFIRNLEKERLINTAGSSTDDKAVTHGTHWSNLVSQHSDRAYFETNFAQNQDNRLLLGGSYHPDKNDQKNHLTDENKTQLKRSSSTSALKTLPDNQKVFAREGVGATFSEEFYSADLVRHREVQNIKTDHAMVISGEGHAPKLKCRVIGAYFEKTGSKSFAVYSIAVRDMAKNTWFVKRRYRNFERLHRHLKDIPNYTLHLPPKRFLSSSIDDEFVHRRCIQLDQYLQDLLSIANVAEQHEVFDFLSVSSKNYSFGKSPSIMKTLAVNVDDAMDDFLRQFKGVSDGLIRKVSGSSPLSSGGSYSISNPNLSWSEDEMNKNSSSQHDRETLNSLSDNEEHDLDGPLNSGEDSVARLNGWHSDNELNSKEFPPRIIKRDEDTLGLGFERNQRLEAMSLRTVRDGYPAAIFPIVPEVVEEPVGVPPEWTPPNVSVPLLNLVDKTFQLNRRGWLRRQVFWISKQILQLVMEDAIDDWLLRQIQWLRRDDVIALGIRWIKDVLWADGTFFIKFGSNQSEIYASQFSPRSMQSSGKQASKPGAFEEQLEAARRASDIKKMILGGAPATLVSLIGPKQYKRCARDVYYFLQSSICLKQLAYGLLELLLVSIFPELHNLVLDINEKMQPT